MLKKITHTLILIAIAITSAWAQAPNQINYQGVARDASGNPLSNQNIKVRLKIRNNTAAGTVQYSEVRSLTTSASGLFNIQIGSGGAASTTGSFASISWGSAPKYLQVEMDPAGGNSYVNMGTQQMVSVPYAQYSNVAGTLKFPVSVTDSVNSSMLSITNKNFNCIQVNSANGLGMYAWSQNYNAVSGENNSAFNGALSGNNYNSGPGVKGASSNGNGIYGTSTSPTAAAIEAMNNSGGPGIKTASSQGNGITALSNASNGYGIYASNPMGKAIYGLTTSNGVAIMGESQSAYYDGIGVYGRCILGKGVFGYSEYGIGVKAKSVDSTALDASCDNGYAIKSSGKIQIAGGNTNPGKGKILTSDSVGNATWESTTTVAFSAIGITNFTVSNSQEQTVQFANEAYDVNSNFNFATNTFIVPVNGIYHFDAQVTWGSKPNSYPAEMKLVKNHNGNITVIRQNNQTVNPISWGTNVIGTDVQLSAGDLVYLSVLQTYGAAVTLTIGQEYNFFNGHLVVKL